MHHGILFKQNKMSHELVVHMFHADKANGQNQQEQGI